ncbi:MAG: pyruvate carboxylase [Vulcanibacillus sp.]
MEIKNFQKVLVANRGEIAIRIFRACTESGIRTVAIYSEEDEISLHRFKADEAYLIGEGKGPIEAYLDIEGIIELAKRNDVDAIHPGYGFLSENEDFARRCEDEGIKFIGPKPEQIRIFGDKVQARKTALSSEIPVIPGTENPIEHLQEALFFVKEHGYPIMIKAAHGGGGRGMRIVRNREELEDSIERAKSEAKSAFGDSNVYIEKYLENPKHIEVQILGDNYGNIVHLYERDCSIQRRHQKVVEVAPSLSLSEELRKNITNAALKLMKNVGYINAGTVEFLVADNKFYFIEVNPRIQVEHTITELITCIDIVETQLKIAQGYPLNHEEIAIYSQDDVVSNGYAIQCRITTEDPENNFMPDYGRLNVYRSAGGFGIRLDAGSAYAGAIITPHYDSLLVKVSTHAKTSKDAAAKMVRTLKEFRVRGVKSNILFLKNVVEHPDFITGNYSTTFIDTHPELFNFPIRQDRATKMLSYIGDISVNGYPNLPKSEKPILINPRIPITHIDDPYPKGTRQLLDELGVEGFCKLIYEQKKVHIADTTFRDAHQSLIATRLRTNDMVSIAEATGKLAPELFSLEMWGGATFDTSMRFLKECPWRRLEILREKIPNILFQMLLRGANAVGYTNYSDNVIKSFIKESAESGIDVFRIFDSLNWIANMKLSIDTVRENGKIAEAAICYAGDILDPKRDKYSLNYYVSMAKELEKSGANIIGIKDMAGLLKPYAAFKLVKTLKEEVGIPIHLHTHDTSGNGQTTLLKAIEANVDIVDTAISSMSGLTSQPSLNGLVALLEGQDRAADFNLSKLQDLSNYWEDVRGFYKGFESKMVASSAEIYKHEMPGGQYSNLMQQAYAVGLSDKFEDIKEMYTTVNNMFGDIVKVTPSSKVVGDMALYMVQNNLTEEEIYANGETLDFPNSVVEFFQGYIGQPYGGFPEKLKKVILKGRDFITCRPGELLPPADIEKTQEELTIKLNREVSINDVLSYLLYPKVFLEFEEHLADYGRVSALDTTTFFYGMGLGEKISVEIEQGKKLIIKLTQIGKIHSDGTRTIYFELNGVPREVAIFDKNANITVQKVPKAEKNNPAHIGASMPGKVLKILVKKGDKVKKGDNLMITEAMKMETTIQASFNAVIKEIYINSGDIIETHDLLAELEQIS